MKRLLICFFALLSAWAGAQAQHASANAISAKPQQFTLANGMTLIVQVDRRAPTAVHMLWVRAGSMDEVDGKSGVAHVLEHMMFKGTQSAAGSTAAGEFSRRVAALGGRENAFTASDYTGYFQQIPANRLEDVMKLEADRFAHNHWPDSEFTKEIEVVKEERRMRTEDEPRALLYETLEATAFVASPYRRPIVGWMNDLDNLRPDDVRAFHRDWYVPANAVVVVAGDVKVPQVRRWAEQYYGKVPARALPERKPRVEPPQTGVKRVEVKAPAEQAYVALAWKVPGLRNIANPTAEDWDAMALTVLAAVLDGYDGARLQRALVQGQGANAKRVADSAGAGNGLTGRGPQLFVLDGSPVAGRTPAELETALREQVARIAREGVSEAELNRVKTQWMAGEVYQRDSLFYRARKLGANAMLNLPLDADDRLLVHLRTITSQQVQSVAMRYFGEDTLTVGVLHPLPPDPQRRSRPMGGGRDF
ncbi:M16 family metallopeptidase [Hylemonella sp. W303a]|uniref:M16 family metallopeptidase n=1 Tax=Hylemonella sp. W303a TaxID=3389873 RepID=UPI00396B3D3B